MSMIDRVIAGQREYNAQRTLTVDQKGKPMNTFDSGATRSTDVVRDDPEGYLSPLFLQGYFEYMTKHRVQADGQVRESDNWQKGIPVARYLKGLWRHFFHLWTRHRGWPVTDPLAADNELEDAYAMMFNLQGYVHEKLKARLTSETEIKR